MTWLETTAVDHIAYEYSFHVTHMVAIVLAIHLMPSTQAIIAACATGASVLSHISGPNMVIREGLSSGPLSIVHLPFLTIANLDHLSWPAITQQRMSTTKSHHR